MTRMTTEEAFVNAKATTAVAMMSPVLAPPGQSNNVSPGLTRVNLTGSAAVSKSPSLRVTRVKADASRAPASGKSER